MVLKYYTVKDISEIFGVSYQSALNLIRNHIGFIKVGSLIKVPAEKLIDFRKNNTYMPKKPLTDSQQIKRACKIMDTAWHI